jgi:hypothetical protein
MPNPPKDDALVENGRLWSSTRTCLNYSTENRSVLKRFGENSSINKADNESMRFLWLSLEAVSKREGEARAEPNAA